MTLGVVSNAWAELLGTTTLEEQCQRAHDAGYGYIELRQRALGTAEECVPNDDRPWPLPDALARLREQAPGLGFNLAVEAPFLTTPVSPKDPYLHRCAHAACALGGDPPVLRLVDLSPAPALLEDEAHIAALGEGVAALGASLWEQGVRLALENSKQPVSALRAVIRSAANRLPEGVPSPQICWDPHNQVLQQHAPENPAETAHKVPVEEFFEYHFKQSQGGVLQGDVTPGDIDWPAIVTAMHERGFRGPTLFELPPGPDIWDRLTHSTAYIQSFLPRT